MLMIQSVSNRGNSPVASEEGVGIPAPLIALSAVSAFGIVFADAWLAQRLGQARVIASRLWTAGPPVDHAARLRFLFEELFYSKMYRQGECGRNIIEFIDEARARGISLSQASVLLVYNQERYGLIPRCARGGTFLWEESIIWSGGWHAVLKHPSGIFDFDFTNTPRVPSLREYFKEMFGFSSRSPKETIFVREVPVAYLLRGGQKWTLTGL